MTREMIGGDHGATRVVTGGVPWDSRMTASSTLDRVHGAGLQRATEEVR